MKPRSKTILAWALVLILLGGLAAVFSSLVSARKEAELDRRNASNFLKQLGTFIALYCDRYQQRPPTDGEGFAKAMKMIEPSLAQEVEALRQKGFRFRFRKASTNEIAQVFPAEAWACILPPDWSGGPHDDDVLVLLYDGSVQVASPGNQHWKAMQELTEEWR